MFVLTPRFVPAFQAPQCGYRVSRPQPRRPQYSSFNHFFSQVDELLSEIDREAQRQAQIEAHVEAQREAHRQRQQRKRALRARFAVNQTEHGWQVDGDIQGFERENINIQVSDENTLKITGNTRWQAEKPNAEVQQLEQQAVTIPQESTETQKENEADTVPTTATEAETVTEPSPDSDTESHRSYQPTVEDDYEDLGAEASSLISASSGASTPAESSEPKGKEKAVEQPAATESAVAQQPQPEAPAQQQQPAEEQRVHGTFERTFRFPERIDAAAVSANFKDGVLSITVPRAPTLQTRRIAIL